MGRWLACAAVACVLAGSAQAAPRVDYAFTVVSPRSVSPSGVVARAILELPAAPCPQIRARTARGATVRLRMARLSIPDGSLGFDGITVCRRPLPRGLVRASVGGRRLPLLRAGTPRRIALFGDTGCRINVTAPTPPATEPSYEIQDCNSPTAWPLETIAGEIAAARPDLVVDTGDYFYRESDCPASGQYAPLCAGSPPVNPPGSLNEDTWAGWRADWFAPARVLFPVAPLVLARGNHESCSRAGTGYFLLLEPGVSPHDTCQRVYTQVYDPQNPPPTVAQPTWVARLGRLDLVVLDSSSANDTAVENADVYAALGRRAVSLLRGGPRTTGWLLTHKPVYGWERFDGPDEPPVWTNLTLQAALDPLVEPFAAVVSGHLHLFQTVELPGRPAQLTLGDGGTLLDPSDQGGELPTFGPAGIPAPSRGTTSFTFGWLLLRPAQAAGVFTGTRYEAGAGPWASCRLAPHSIDCRPL
jgi:hypothetical protein